MQSSPPKAALLVGVDDYTAYDASLGQPAGTSNLRGALADVRSWYVIARRLGIPAENIEVRTSPVLSAKDMPIDATGTRFGPATHDAILDGVQALGSRLAGGGLPQGLLTWSGHGASGADGALLCPADVTGSLENAISYTKLTDALDAHVPEHALTIVLDTCHAAPSRFGGRLLAQPTRFLGAPGSTPAPAVVRSHDRVLAACGAGGTSQEYHFQGVWHGAFSWAATTVLERWPDNDSEGAHYIGIDYAELLARAAAVLQGASFAQVPRWNGPAGDATVPFGYPSSAASAPASEQANAGPLQEIDPAGGLGIYTLKSFDGTTALGYVVAVGSADSGVWKANREYWVWNNPQAAFPPTGWSLYAYGTTIPTGLTPTGAFVYENKPFPATATPSEPTSPQTGAWFKLDRGPNTGAAGWFNRTTGLQTWYEFGDTGGSASPWLVTLQGATYLRFKSGASVPNPLINVSVVSDAVTTG